MSVLKAIANGGNTGGGGGTGTIQQITSTGGTITVTNPTGPITNLESAAGGGTVTTTGSPASGNLTKFSGATSITNTDLSGDVTTNGSTLTTVAKIQGTTVSGTTGSGNVVFSSAPTLANPVVGTQATSDNSTKAASTAYVTTAISNAISGVNPAVAVLVATTQASDTSSLTYNNGVSGVGATFTGSNNTALTFDGVTLTSLNQRVLVKNDTQSPSGAFNGVYYLTQIQAALLPPILTRALDYNQPSDINSTGAIPVISGTVNTDTSWLLTSTVNTVGTDALTYVQFTINPSTIQTLTSANPAYMLWNSVIGTTQTAAVNNGYVTSNAGLTTITLPAAATVTDRIAIVGAGAGGWKLAQNASQKVNFGNVVTTTGTGGSIASQNTFDCLEIICTTTNTTFVVRNAQGNMTVV